MNKPYKPCTYTVTKRHSDEWIAEAKFEEYGRVTWVTRISHSPFDALRQLMQVTGELEPLEAKQETGEA